MRKNKKSIKNSLLIIIKGLMKGFE